jgi:hypothetical protein
MSDINNYNNFYNKHSKNIDSLLEHENRFVSSNINNHLDAAYNSTDLNEIRKEDADFYRTQENYLYILGTITFAIVFLGAIVIIKN